MSKLIPKNLNANSKLEKDKIIYDTPTEWEPTVLASKPTIYIDLYGIRHMVNSSKTNNEGDRYVEPISVTKSNLKEAGNGDMTGIRKGIYRGEGNSLTFTPVIDNERDINTYSANQEAGSVHLAMNEAGQTIAPAALSLVNPGSFASSVTGGLLFDEMAKSSVNSSGRHYTGWGDMVHDKTGLNEAAASFTNPGYLINPEIMSQPIRIANNIKNRNRFFYRYLPPAGYKEPLAKGKDLIKRIITEDVSDIPDVPLQKVHPRMGHYIDQTYIYNTDAKRAKADALASRFRDAAYRKYLGLPEKEPIYLDNGDGTFRYNLDYTRQLMDENGITFTPTMKEGVTHDFVTGNGGQVGSRMLENGDVQEITDVWDLHPFSRKNEHFVEQYVNPKAWKLETNIKSGLRNIAENIGIDSKAATDFLKNACDYQVEFFDPEMFTYPGIRGNIYSAMNLNLIPKIKINPSNWKWMLKLDDKITNYEVGPILGGKPFTMKTQIPTHYWNIDIDDLLAF